MKVVIAGGTGFIGSHLVRRLLASGLRCTVVARSVETQVPDGAQLATYSSLPSEADAVVNLTGESIVGRWNSAKKKRIVDSRIGPTKQLVEWMAGLSVKPSVFLSGSAVGIYGDRGDLVLTENTVPDPKGSFLAEVCEQWEQEANRAADLGIRVVNLRTANVIDKDAGMLAQMVRSLRLSPVIVPYAPHSSLAWISLADEVGMIEFALKNKEVVGPVNLVGPSSATVGDLFQAIASALKKPMVGRLPDWAVGIALGEFAEAVLASQNARPEKLLACDYKFQDPDLGKFVEGLDLRS